MPAIRKYYDAHLTDRFAEKRVLVTGGFGFIGGHVAAKLSKYGARVDVIDIDASAARPSLLNEGPVPLRQSMKIIEGSIADFELVNQLFAQQRYDFVLNMAAYASTVEKAVDDPLATFDANSFGVVALLEAMRRNDNVPEMLFHASTDKVYGELIGDAYDENDPLGAAGLYDTAKMAADAITRSYSTVFGIPAVVLRMCNIFGPYDLNIGSRLLPKSLYSMFAGDRPEPPTLYAGSQGHSRDYLYIDDLVYTILLLTAESHWRGQAFNSVACAHLTTPEMIRQVFQSAVSEANRFDPTRASQIERNGIRMMEAEKSAQVLTITRQHLKSDRLRNAIAFTPLVSLEEGVQKTVSFYRKYFGTTGEQPSDAVESEAVA
ncbi:MAG TPA: NAD-dependent epimerase/dehydratase family protein [Burkholderiaceae bacterium]|nr:NAD-dependent epimerase/dehydratase family protein [Burkholderiaceae bacterium]